MDRLFRPWRYAYVAGERPDGPCVLCRIGSGDAGSDESVFIIGRFRRHFVVLNVFPYNSGHLMIVPYDHVASLRDLGAEALHEMADLARKAEGCLLSEYGAEGVNLGMNLGRAAGAGIADHLHLHVVPRWQGDTSFMSVTAESRVLPEGLRSSWDRLRASFGVAT